MTTTAISVAELQDVADELLQAPDVCRVWVEHLPTRTLGLEDTCGDVYELRVRKVVR